MSFLTKNEFFYYTKPDIPREFLTKAAETVGYDGDLEDVQLVEAIKVKYWGIPFEEVVIITHDMAYFKYPLNDTFTLKLYSDTEISYASDDNTFVQFNGQTKIMAEIFASAGLKELPKGFDKDIPYHVCSSKGTMEFLKKLIAELPASPAGIMSQFERINAPKMYCRGQIPEKKLQAALAVYKEVPQRPNAEDVMMLIDDTFMGKADNHLLITKDMFYFNRFLERPMQRRLYSDTSITYAPPEKESSLCTLLLNGFPVCSISEESSAKLLVECLQLLQKECPAQDTSYMGIFEQIIDKEISVKPYIPAKFITNSLTNFKLDLPAESIRVIIDDTVLDSFKNGIIVTKDCLYIKKLCYDAFPIPLSADTRIELDSDNQLVVNGKVIFKFNSAPLAAQTLVRGLQCLAAQAGKQDHLSAVAEKASQIVHKQFFVAPYIPKDKLTAAISEYAPGVSPEDVIGLFDATLSGNGKEGILLTEDTLYAASQTVVNPFKKAQTASLKDMLKSVYKTKAVIGPNDVIVSKGDTLLINGNTICSFVIEGKDFLPQLVEVLNVMKTN